MLEERAHRLWRGLTVTRRQLFWLAAVPAGVGFLLAFFHLNLGMPGALLKSYALAFFLAISIWLISRGLKIFLWRVSRRLAFSYFLIGVVPIPLVLILALVAAYIASGFFLGHLYRDAVASVANDLRFAAHRHLEQILRGNIEPIDQPIDIDFAYYRDGVKLAGAESAPAEWQHWWPADTLDHISAQLDALPIVAGAEGVPTLAATVRSESYGILAVFTGDLSRELSERSGIWVELFRADDPRSKETTKITIFNREYRLDPPRSESAREDLKAFFHPGIDQPNLFDRPSVAWPEISAPFVDLDTGEIAAKYVSATLFTNLRTLYYQLVSPTSQVHLSAYAIFFAVAFLLFDIGIIAALMAFLMILGLSRAVNRLSTATERVQQGDFSTRIEVRRRDQIGALQNNFNQMAANLENLVAAEAQKEILEKEISIAQDLQHSLLPDTLKAPPSLRFAAHFEPSAAIGGDYYDLLPMGGDRLGVVMADVSGHGLSAGLRMAMVKSALALLCEEERRPEEILRRLHELMRHRLQSQNNGRGFVTATLALVDSTTGEFVVTNAGHTPTYLLRAGEVSEIVLPSTPLGTLGADYGQDKRQLEPGDVVVWLSDGLIEATNSEGQDFGFERITETLSGLNSDPMAVRDHVLETIHQHTDGRPPADDCTLLVMAYRPDF